MGELLATDMSLPNLKVTCIADRKARKIACKKRMQGLIKKAEELTILCDISACLIFFSGDDDKSVVWPSQETAKALIDRFNALPCAKRNKKAVDEESHNENNIKNIEKKLAHSQEVITELEMDYLIFQLQNGRSPNDLTQTEVDDLISYASKKITSLKSEVGCKEHPYTSVDEPVLGDDIQKASDVEPERGPCFRPMGRGSVALMDKWFFDGPKLPMASRFDLNVEPCDEDEDMES